MTDTNYFEEKLRSMAIEKYTKENKKLIAAQINEQSQKVQLAGLVCGKDAIALSGVTSPMFYAAKRFNPKEFPQEIYHETEGYIWYRKQDIVDFFAKHPARRYGSKYNG
ncbi:hypothetical protein QJE62_004136 [Salmonella enterica]|uniref:Uncharacterized protein n=11 Tax=Salmonella enterica TaxID=28901 RepID=A0A4S3DE44_SALON|nr:MULTISPECIES: hypothetical protein [Salmonella]EAA7727049.1 hypothetical protein [Salmonella enterica subsp. enterica serovar Pomona]EAN3243298.1 hypothetical protein [Salmonella enterica subsp. enterica serovar Give]EBB0743098.1 hypothetical protein [Salmonella enterica subsp. enterica serovar Livingstone]EBU8873776.1 hypothetical protein [Salmonella enterica subsp. enterica serovar Seattle]EBV2534785.1 hypothetical protein [Salmonella enterica subsp. enterica serovar Agbeni]EBV4109510.1 